MLQFVSINIVKTRSFTFQNLEEITRSMICDHFLSSDLFIIFINLLKDTRKEKVPSDKTPVITKSMNMDIWLVGTSNQLFISGS